MTVPPAMAQPEHTPPVPAARRHWRLMWVLVAVLVLAATGTATVVLVARQALSSPVAQFGSLTTPFDVQFPTLADRWRTDAQADTGIAVTERATSRSVLDAHEMITLLDTFAQDVTALSVPAMAKPAQQQLARTVRVISAFVREVALPLYLESGYWTLFESDLWTPMVQDLPGDEAALMAALHGVTPSPTT